MINFLSISSVCILPLLWSKSPLAWTSLSTPRPYTGATWKIGTNHFMYPDRRVNNLSVRRDCPRFTKEDYHLSRRHWPSMQRDYLSRFSTRPIVFWGKGFKGLGFSSHSLTRFLREWSVIFKERGILFPFSPFTHKRELGFKRAL